MLFSEPVAYLEFGSMAGGGCPASPTCSKGTFLLNYNFVHSVNTISEYEGTIQEKYLQVL